MVDWGRAAGLDIVCAGKGTKYLPAYHASTPETVWGHYGFSEAEVGGAYFTPGMFNSCLGGTKSAIEMAGVANAPGVEPASSGLAFPACGVDDLPRVLKPEAAGGVLHHKGTVEVVSSLERDGRPVFRDLRWGVYVTFEAPSDYVRRCFAEYGLVTDQSGRYAAMYKPYHLIGLELGVSVASAGLRGEATGSATGFRGDAVATAKRALSAGEKLDGEGGLTVYGRLVPAAESLARRAFAIRPAPYVAPQRPVGEGEVVRWGDVALDETGEAVRIRREMEGIFRQEWGFGGIYSGVAAAY